MTDTTGHFEIPNLDPKLRFELLLVADGYVSAFHPNIDPAEDQPVITLQPYDSTQIAPNQLSRGRVIDSYGDPIANAIIEVRGWSTEETTTWGRSRRVMKTPIAVTNSNGQFELATRQEVTSLQIDISCRNYAHQEFYDLALGGLEQAFTLFTGVTVSGRLIHNGQPVANRRIQINSQRSTPRSNFTHNAVVTNPRGEFVFYNLPSTLTFNVAAAIDSIPELGRTPIRRIGPWTEGHSEDIGDLAIEPGFRISGTVKTLDGQTLPETSLLLIDHRDTWGLRSFPLSSDGKFALQGLHPGAMRVNVKIPGYRLAARNDSFSGLNRGELLGTLSKSTERLVILVEPGKWHEAPRRPDFLAGEDAQSRPLRGVESLLKSQQAASILIQVRDQVSSAPITSFKLTPGWLFEGGTDPIWQSYQQRIVTGRSDKAIVIAKRSGRAYVRIEADNYLPQYKEVEGLHGDSIVVHLTPGKGYRGQILTPEGEPAVGAQVLLTKHWPNSDRHYLVFIEGTSFRDDSIKRHDVDLTDLSGRFQLPAKDSSHPIIIVHPSGYAAIEHPSSSEPTTIRLQKWGAISGSIKGGAAADLQLGINRLEPRIQADTNNSIFDRFLTRIGINKSRERSDFWDFILVTPRTTRHSDGTFLIEDVPPGRWNVQLMRIEPYEGGSIGKRVRSTITDVAAGKTAPIELIED
ncbi:MAG: carboxypeptidase regulatory-like domain-containing protein [Verrucomicrobia bacterium]|nr:carboxypeptidase regulatory-like domain-containing protein [Verrucomicrobiota bacterium]